MKNGVQLITYVDRLGGGTLAQLATLLRGPLAGLFTGVHLLPFFDAIDGADAGFDPTDHTRVDPRLGQWQDVQALSAEFELMADVIVNHVSSASPQFRDYLAKAGQSPWCNLFLTLDGVFEHGATEAGLTRIYRPRPGLPFTVFQLADGTRRILWTTFTAQQIDINVDHPQGRAYLEGILQTFAANGIRMLRLDAAGYAIKKPGTSCFMIPETFGFIGRFAAQARSMGMEVLVEIHSYYRRQIEIAARVDWVYDFALPPLLLHALTFRTAARLRSWIEIRPNNALTVLDTHDGIGIIDIGRDPADPAGSPGLVPDEELDRLVECIHENSGGASRQATGAAASNLDLYQVNCTFYDALGRDDRAYLIARAVQFFLPGIPQVYYVGLLAGENDLELLRRTGVGRDINRHYYTEAQITQALRRDVVRDLIALIQLRNSHPAFGGSFRMLAEEEGALTLCWQHHEQHAQLKVSFRQRTLQLWSTDASGNARELALCCNANIGTRS